MSESIFDNNLVIPDDKMLAAGLGSAQPLFDSICQFIEKEYNDLTPEWKFYNQKSGWILKLFNRKRNVLFIVPCRGYFRAAFTMGDKAVDEVIGSDLPDGIKEVVFTAKKYAEGRTFQLDVATNKDVKIIIQLVRIKLNN